MSFYCRLVGAFARVRKRPVIDLTFDYDRLSGWLGLEQFVACMKLYLLQNSHRGLLIHMPRPTLCH